MTHIALIAGTYQPDRCGVAHYTAQLRSHLHPHNITSTVLTSHDAAAASDDPHVVGVTENWKLQDLLPLAKALQASKAEILHVQHAAGTYGFERAIFLLPLLLKVMGWQRPIVTTVHEYGWWEWQPPRIPLQLLEWLKQWGQRRGWWDREDGFLLTLSDALITTNADAERVLRSRLPYLESRIRRIPIAANITVTPINPISARSQLHQHCHWPDDAIVLVFFGFLHPVKGLETLLPAFQQVQARYLQTRLLLVGGVESLALRGEQATNYWDQLHDRVKSLDLSDRVHLTGYVSAETASQYLSGCDIGVLTF